MEHISGQQSAHRADCKVKLYGMPNYPAPNPCNCEELDKAQYSVSMTRQYLQDQLDSNSELIVRLTEALRKSEAEKGVLLAAAVRASQDINWMLNNRQFLNSDVFDYLHKALTSVNP